MDIASALNISSQAVKRTVASVKRHRFISHTAPSGRIYDFEWTRPSDPTPADIARTKEIAMRMEAEAGPKPTSAGVGAEIGGEPIGFGKQLADEANRVTGSVAGFFRNLTVPVEEGIRDTAVRAMGGQPGYDPFLFPDKKQWLASKERMRAESEPPISAEGALAGLLTLPLHVGADAAVVVDPKSTWEMRTRATANILGNFVGPAEVASMMRGTGSFSKSVYRQISGKLGERTAQAVKQSVEGGRAGGPMPRTEPSGGRPGVGVKTKPIEEAMPGFKRKGQPAAEPPAKTPDAPTASGLSRSSRAIQADYYGTNKPVTIHGKTHEQLYAEGKTKVDEGFDFEGEMDELAKGGRPASDEQIGIFSAGRDKLIEDLNRLNARLDRGDQAVLAERDTLFERIAEFDRNLDEVKGAGGRSLASFKIGHVVNWADLDEVLLEARRVKPTALTSGNEKNLRLVTEKLKTTEGRAAQAEEELARVRAEGSVAAHRPRAKGGRFDKAELDKELADLFEEGKKALSKVSAGLDPELLKIAGRIGLNYAKRGVNTLDEIVANVQGVWRAQFGQEIDRQSVIDGMALRQTEVKTKTEIEQQIAEMNKQVGRLRAQAKREGTANFQKIEADIADLKNQLTTGQYRTPTKREVVLSRQLENLRNEKALYAAKVRGTVERLKLPEPGLLTKGAKEVTGIGKILTLGADFGALLRQGLHGIASPKSYAKAIANVRQGIKSEADLFALEMSYMEKKAPDGTLLEKVRKEANLSRSSVGVDPEEGYLIGVLDKVLGGTVGRIPGLKNVGGALGRGQAALLNSVRNEMFDGFYLGNPGATKQELKDYAAFLNSAFGRSATYGTKRTPTELAQIVLTSPRYEASRWEMVGNWVSSPATAVKALKDKAARAKIINMAATGGTVLTTLGITAAATGGELILDPEDPDFLKIRIGERVVDMTAGIAPRLRGLIRAFYWFKDPEAQTKYRKSDGEPYKRNELLPGEIVKTATRPVSPAVTALAEERTGYSLSGWREDEGDPRGWERLMPLILQGLKQDLEKGGAGEAATNLGIEFFGGSVQRYPRPPRQ